MWAEFTVDISRFGVLEAGDRRGRLDRGALTDLAQAIEAAGIDRLLLAERAHAQDVATLASYILHATSALGIQLEHRAGAVQPEIAARQIATLDQLGGGRLATHVLPPHHKDLSHEESLARLDEYLTLLKRLWSNDKPIDHEGRFHRLGAAYTAVKPFSGASVPIALSGISGTALQVAARHAQIFVLPPTSLNGTRNTIERVRVAAACYGRANAIRYALPVHPLPAGRGFNRAANALDGGDDAIAAVGSPEGIASTLSDYLAIGVTEFFVKGLRTTGEISTFGKAVASLVRGVGGDTSIGDRSGSRPAQFAPGRAASR
jgi:alkanesulfonate monooxygenase